jgi:hypothetical protein
MINCERERVLLLATYTSLLTFSFVQYKLISAFRTVRMFPKQQISQKSVFLTFQPNWLLIRNINSQRRGIALEHMYDDNLITT